MHISGRMVLWDVERLKIVMIRLNVRPFGNGKAHALKDRADLFHYLGDGMELAKQQSTTGKAEIHVFGS